MSYDPLRLEVFVSEEAVLVRREFSEQYQIEPDVEEVLVVLDDYESVMEKYPEKIDGARVFPDGLGSIGTIVRKEIIELGFTVDLASEIGLDIQHQYDSCITNDGGEEFPIKVEKSI